MPSLISRIIEFVIAVFGNAWGIWGGLSAAMPLLAQFAGAFMSDDLRKKVERRLPSTPAHRRALFVAVGAICLSVSSFLAFDKVNQRLRTSQTELAQLKSGEALQQLSAERAHRDQFVAIQLSRFHSQALDLWRADITKDQYPRWAQHYDAFIAGTSKWVENNLGSAAKDKLLAKPAFPKAIHKRFVDPAHEEKLLVLNSIIENIRELMRDIASGQTAPNPATIPLLQSSPPPATGTQP